MDDYSILGGFTGVHQFCRLGSYSFSAIGSVIVKDVPPFILVSGNTARPAGLNREGLKRHNFSAEEVEHLRKAYKLVYRDGLLLRDAVERLAPLARECGRVAEFARFIEQSTRGIVR